MGENTQTISLQVLDMHTAGEPVRIVTGGYPPLIGRTILEKRRYAAEHHDALRRAIMLEPRGHEGMYGVLPVEPSIPGAAAAVLFTHASGYSTMCGHATIAIGRWLVESGIVRAVGDFARFSLEVPCGVVEVECQLDEGRVREVAFLSVPAYVERSDYVVSTTTYGSVAVDIAFGGAFYAILPASRIGLDLIRTPLRELAAAGTEITARCREGLSLRHPDADMAFLYGTILTDDSEAPDPTYNLCIFGEGQIDRSPTGSGVTARMALDHAAGRIGRDVPRVFKGVSGEPFTGTVTNRNGEPVRIRVAGMSHVSGNASFVLATDDPFRHGFILPQRLGEII